MVKTIKVDSKVVQKFCARRDKSETIHPEDGEEKEDLDLFQSLQPQNKEEQLDEEDFQAPDLCASEEMALRGLPDALKGKQLKAQAYRTEDYDPNRDERNFGCCMKFFLCLCFCSC